MNFKAWTSSTLDGQTLKKDYDGARGIGAVSIGDHALYFRKRVSLYYVPYEAIERCFRRVNEVPAKMGCCMGSYDRESLVINPNDGTAPVEVSLPDTRCARAAIDEIKKRSPKTTLGCVAEAPGISGIPAAE